MRAQTLRNAGRREEQISSPKPCRAGSHSSCGTRHEHPRSSNQPDDQTGPYTSEIYLTHFDCSIIRGASRSDPMVYAHTTSLAGAPSREARGSNPNNSAQLKTRLYRAAATIALPRSPDYPRFMANRALTKSSASSMQRARAATARRECTPLCIGSGGESVDPGGAADEPCRPSRSRGSAAPDQGDEQSPRLSDCTEHAGLELRGAVLAKSESLISPTSTLLLLSNMHMRRSLVAQCNRPRTPRSLWTRSTRAVERQRPAPNLIHHFVPWR